MKTSQGIKAASNVQIAYDESNSAEGWLKLA